MKADAAVPGEPGKRRRCGRPHRDVVGVSGDAVWSEGQHHVRAFFLEDVGDQGFEMSGGEVRNSAVRKTEPLMAIGHSTDRTPAGFIFASPDCTESRCGGVDSRRDLAGVTVRRVNEYEPQPGVVPMECDVSRCTHHIIVGVGNHKGDHSAGALSHLSDSALLRPGSTE